MLHFPLISSINFMNRLNKTEYAGVFLNCRFSLFLNDPFFQIILIWHIMIRETIILACRLGLSLTLKVPYLLSCCHPSM